MYLYLVNASYVEMQGNGSNKEVSESYLVEANGISEAEARVIAEAGVEAEFEVKAASRKKAYAVLSDVNSDDWFEVNINVITIDVAKDVEKRKKATIFVQKSDIESAIKAVKDYMSGSITDYEIVSAKITNIVDYFKFNETEE